MRFMPDVKQPDRRPRARRSRNNFVNYSLCCPSRATFLTGQYAHNHGVLSNNEDPTAATSRSTTATRSRSGCSSAGYYTGHIGKYLNGYERRPEHDPARVDRVARLDADLPVLRLPAERERHAGRLRDVRRPVLDRRLHPEGGRLHRAPGARIPAVLPLGRLPRAARRRPEPEPAAAGQLPGQRQAGAAPCDRVRRRAAARSRRRSTRPTSPTSRRAIQSDPLLDDADIANIQRALPLPARVAARRRRGREQHRRRRCATQGELDNTLFVYTSDNGFMHGEHRDPGRQGRALRALDPRPAR